MDFDGEFHLVKKDGIPFQYVYHHPKYNPIPQTQISITFGEPTNHDQHLFLCPHRRIEKSSKCAVLSFSPEYILPTTRTELDNTSTDLDEVDDHPPILPLFWCNNKSFEVDGVCPICSLNTGTDYYFCESHKTIYHKECVEAPLKIKHPYHPDHFFLLYYNHPDLGLPIKCLCCGEIAQYLVYYCSICHDVMHTICAIKMVPFFIDSPKRHDHPLTLFPRQTSLTCNVCGLLQKNYPTYVCLICNFVAHNDCMYYPSLIKISRHPHRLSYVSSFKPIKWTCGVCRKNVNGDYGVYTCEKCDGYAVHPRCALRRDVWDGEELEGVPEEDIFAQDGPPYEIISETERVLRHFLHGHHLKWEFNKLYDENKRCQGCVLPISGGDYYFSCVECDFFVHGECVRAPRRIQHQLHPHPLTLKSVCGYDIDIFQCNACGRSCGGFGYQCPRKECNFDLDTRCGAMREPLRYKGHEHPLFLSLDPEEKPTCHVCKSECLKQFNCLECDFVICFECVTLPYDVRYKHDKHLLTLLWGGDVCEKDWCELCERNLKDTSTKFIYWCKDCCTTLHVACLLGEDPYMKPDEFFDSEGTELKILAKSNLARPLCDSCKYPCQGNIFSIDNRILCSSRCLRIYNEM